jgi:hypothetical protein
MRGLVAQHEAVRGIPVPEAPGLELVHVVGVGGVHVDAAPPEHVVGDDDVLQTVLEILVPVVGL